MPDISDIKSAIGYSISGRFIVTVRFSRIRFSEERYPTLKPYIYSISRSKKYYKKLFFLSFVDMALGGWPHPLFKKI